MKVSDFSQRSLKTRVVLFTLTIFLVSTWGLSFYASLVLRKDIERLLGEQQFSAVSLLAAQINQELSDHLITLERIAASIPPAVMSDATSLQEFLEQRQYFQSQFNEGIRAFGVDGTMLAIVPHASERVGINLMDRDYMIGAIKEGKPTIGKPVIGKVLNAPIFLMTVPVLDPRGKVIGALAGVTNLGKPNFLDKITETRYGKTGGYLLIDKRQRLIVTATEKSRIMNELQAPGVNPVVDRYGQGYAGSAIYTNTRGVEVLSSAMSIPVADWFILSTLPTSEAFSPVRDLRLHILLATLLLTLAAGGLTWWMLKRQLSPLLVATKTLSALSDDTSHPPSSLLVTRRDEIGQLIESFNRLLGTLAAREGALKESEKRYREIFQASMDSISIVRLNDGVILEVNPALLDLHGYEREEVIGFPSSKLSIWFDPVERQRFIEILQQDSRCVNHEGKFRKKNGDLIWGLVSAAIMEFDGVPCIISIRRDITERKQAEERINRLAFFDQLTGLPNRTLLLDRLNQAKASSLRSGRYGGLLLIDLDHFKTLNDTLGHEMGDLLLKQVAQRLIVCVREEDTVARLGGDEFVVMLVSLSDSQSEAALQIKVVGDKIITALNQVYDLMGSAYHTTPSIGASVFSGQQTDTDTLLKQADLAMYKAKDAGRNTLRFFDPEMARDVLERASLTNDLREALEKQQFVLNYQAQSDNGRVIGAEVLLRWQHPERGLVSPGEFIPLAEETGLILPIGHWVLETACAQLARWASEPELSHLTIAVNVSARQFHHENFVDQVLMALDQSGADPKRLKLELTESLLIINVEDIIGKMNALKAQGVGFSLDDFGTGYSSLTYLKRLPLDQLKIDQSFVRDILTDSNDSEIAKMIVVLAESLGLGVIAEGVEEEAQRDRLAQYGCHAYQGYFFSRPLPLDEFDAFVKRI